MRESVGNASHVQQNLWSAKITVLVYILICLEVGIMLLILPWTRYWDDNFFLYFITSKLNSPGFFSVFTSGWMRGAVTGLGVINILAGLRDVIKFRESVRVLAGSDESLAHEAATSTKFDLPDHQPPSVPPQSSND